LNIVNRRWSVFLSGQGTTAQAAFECMPNIDIGLVVSNNPDAYGLIRAQKFGLPIFVQPKLNWYEVQQKLMDYKITHIFLLGFMKIVPEDFVQLWTNRIFNIHPSLLPAYKGLHAIEKSYQDKSDMGVTIHRVTSDLDAGEILMQKKVFSSSEVAEKNNFDFEVKPFVSATEQMMIKDFLINWKEC
jgi:phosphoribosylglycinamide formyltransferase 1